MRRTGVHSLDFSCGTCSRRWDSGFERVTCFAPPWDANVDFPTNTKGRYVRTLTLVRGASGPASGAQPMHTDRSGGTVGTLGRPAACYTRVLAPAGWRAESGTRGASGASAGRGLAVGPQSSRLLLRPQDEALRRVSAHLRPQGWVRLVCESCCHFSVQKVQHTLFAPKNGKGSGEK